MKKRILFIVSLILNLTFLQAQTTVVFNIGLPQGMIVIGDDLYIGASDPNAIFKANIAGGPTSATLYIPGIVECNGFGAHGDNLYICSLHGDIYKTDLTVSPPVATLITQPSNEILGSAIKDDFLYFSTGSGNQIMKIDVTNPSPVAEIVLSGSAGSIFGITLDGNELYFCQRNTVGPSTVKKIDISNSNPVPITIATGFGSPLFGIAKHGTDIYVTERSQNRIRKIDLANGNTVSNFLSLDLPHGLTVAGSDLYISQPFENRIVKVNLQPLSVEDFQTQNEITIVPNPSTDFINISGLVEDTDYAIYDTSGKLIKQGHIDFEELINIQELKSGLYFIKLDNDLTPKFVKN